MTDHCVLCGGELREDKAWSGDEYSGGYVRMGTFHCTECGLRYEFCPPDHLQKKPVEQDLITSANK